ncbi:LPXTG cell wall anchor domain-containing protein [Streptomyces cynarae]|uniref:LPXTG cell wall anchor domain-containing protein n=1 Tax=Streptomyces cynarae TaxID=2981134 RepID=A0ABY6E2X5_9ACTN|nr:LPXTG cell wall anchor domain-containing protein [Streptomyces cynarae]UXY21010.1 LPXTG cell wall anchor domain-containing protein [Streptomyces cynarae]
MLIGAPLVGAQAAFGQPYPPTPPLTLPAGTTLTAGEPVDFSVPAEVFPHDAPITVLLESTPVVLGHFTAAGDGSVSGTVTIPKNAVNGWHVLRVTADNAEVSVGVTVFVQGGLTQPPPPSPSPTPTKSPRPTKSPTHRPTHPGSPGHHSGHGGHDDGPGGSHGRVAVGDRADYQHQNHDHHRSLAATGSDGTLVLGGTAAALFMVGGGTMLAVRRRRSS